MGALAAFSLVGTLIHDLLLPPWIGVLGHFPIALSLHILIAHRAWTVFP